jgi:hypothetical protein
MKMLLYLYFLARSICISKSNGIQKLTYSWDVESMMSPTLTSKGAYYAKCGVFFFWRKMWGVCKYIMLIYETEEKNQCFYEILVCFFCYSPWYYYDIIYLWLRIFSIAWILFLLLGFIVCIFTLFGDNSCNLNLLVHYHMFWSFLSIIIDINFALEKLYSSIHTKNIYN